jgi:hypothetical protein
MTGRPTVGFGPGRRPPCGRPRGIALALAAAALLTACSVSPGNQESSGSQAPSGTPASSRFPSGSSPGGSFPASLNGPAWLLTRAALTQVRTDPAVREKLRGARIYEILRPGQRPLPGVTAEPVVTFASAAALTAAISGGQLGAGVYGVLYDPEAWSLTPLAEQRDPVSAAIRAAAVAHAHGLRLIVTPALNLSRILSPGAKGPRWRTFLSSRLGGRLAKVADVIEFQAQSLERDAGTYASFVRAAASQARTANPAIGVLAGLSTNPPGTPVDAPELTAAIGATRSVVAGYWLNIPGPGLRCPTCNLPRSDLAIEVMRQFS